MLGTSPIDSEAYWWQTPKSGNFGRMDWGLKELKQWYDLKLDVCAEDPLQSCCRLFLTMAETYRKPWSENFLMNPPWLTKILEKMLTRAISQCSLHHVIGVCILPAYTGADWFKDLVIDACAEITPITGRMKFWKDGEPYPGSPNIDTIIAIYNYAEVK